jgi:hypothetical protein
MRLVALGAVLSLAVAAGVAPGASSETPYPKRVQLLERLAVRYPGNVEPRASLGKYGLWAGILMQTRWQEETGRDRIPLWSLINHQLSVEPSIYASELEKAGRTRDPRAICKASPYVRRQPRPASGGPAVSLRDVCEMWIRYFVAAKGGVPAATILELSWHAHTTAIVYGLRAHRSELESVRTTPLERNFWTSWAEIVFLLEAARFPTGATASTRASRLLMPPCSPIGARGCALRYRDLGRSLTFVSALVLRRPGTVERVFRLYERLRSGPLTVKTLALTDPALASALRLYLGVVGRTG